MKRAILSLIGVAATAAFGHSANLLFVASLNGANERPTPVATNATGAATLTVDDVTGVWSLVGSYTGLTAASTLAHIHAPAGVNGTASPAFDLTHSSAVSGTLTGASNPPGVPTYTPQQITDLINGLHYVNVHSSNFPGGEIRGQLFPIPEPAAFGLGLLGTLLIFRRRHH